MKKNLILIAGLFILSNLITLNGCKKDDDSAFQLKGNYGNANVYSGQFTVTWTLSAPAYYCDIIDNNITQAVLDYGSVQVYMNSGSNGWIALPYTIPMSSSYSTTYAFAHYLGSVRVIKSDTDYTQTVNPGATTFKIVCISASGRKANPNVNLNNYEEVKKAFNLID